VIALVSSSYSAFGEHTLNGLLHFHLSHMVIHDLYHLHYDRLHLLLLVQYFILNSRLALQQILSSIDLFLSYRTDSTDSRTM